MNGQIVYLIVSGNLAGMRRGFNIAMKDIVDLVTTVVRPWMKEEPVVQVVDTDGEYDITDKTRLRIAQTIRELPETRGSVIVLLCKEKFQDAVNYLNKLDLGHSDLRIILGWANHQLTAPPKGQSPPPGDTSRHILKLCTDAAASDDLSPGLHIVHSVRSDCLMQVKPDQVVHRYSGKDGFFVV